MWQQGRSRGMRPETGEDGGRRSGGEGFTLFSCSLSACGSQCSTVGCLNNAAAFFLVSAHVYLTEPLPQPA